MSRVNLRAGASIRLGVAGPTSTRRDTIRALVARRGPGCHHEYEAQLRSMTDDDLAAELERTKDEQPWRGERAPADAGGARVLPPMSGDDGTA